MATFGDFDPDDAYDPDDHLLDLELVARFRKEAEAIQRIRDRHIRLALAIAWAWRWHQEASA